MNNLPDDWGMYYTRCSTCGYRFHLSEGGCDRCAERDEECRECKPWWVCEECRHD